jgi:hypothetical protein
VSYTLFDKRGPVHYIGSIGGMNDLLDFVAKQRTSGPLKEFLDRGKTRDMQGVIGEITALIPYCNNASVKITLLELKGGLAKSKGVAIISD